MSTPTAVVKLGGQIVADRASLGAVLEDVGQLARRGWRFVLCHGGGQQAGALQKRLGLPTVMVGGQRVTDVASLQVTKQVLAGEVNADVTAAAVAAGISAVGVSGISAATIAAQRRPPVVVSGGGDEPVDFGFVGDIERIDPALLRHLWDGGFTPVLNPLGIQDPDAPDDAPGQIYNINADTVAASVAAALQVDHLFLLTDVPGVLRDRDDPHSRIPRLDAAAARQAIDDGVIVGGMIPKVEEALANLQRGIGAVHILAPGPGVLRAAATLPGTHGTVLEP